MPDTPYEIGSEYYLSPNEGQLPQESFHHLLVNFNKVLYYSGRCAIRAILRQLNGKRALLPAYICQSVIQAFEQEHCSIVFYNINPDLSPDLEDIYRKYTPDTNIFFLIHYYGRLQQAYILDKVQAFCKAHGIIILEDTTQSILSKAQTIGDYCAASLRKWFALPDGGVVYSKHPLAQPELINGCLPFSDVRAAGMYLKGFYMHGLHHCRDVYRRCFSLAETMLEQTQGIQSISAFSEKQIAFFDTAAAARIRKENSRYLYENIRAPFIQPVFQEFSNEACPFFHPLYVKNRDAFRKHLEKNSIFCPVHWPVQAPGLLDFESIREISRTILSIPIDQRYGLSDMEYICGIINGYNGGDSL